MIYSFVILCSLLAKPVAAQNVTVTVTPVQQILPPQAMLYMSNPDRYFTITLINNTQAVQNVYLGLSMEQTMPTSGLSLSTPPNRQPQKAIVLPPNQPVTLDVVAMKNLFNHIPKNEIRTSPGLISDYENGAFGLLPEGQYKAQITAYKWDPLLQNPVILSSPTGGICNFTICYKGQAPQFLTPATNGISLNDLSVAKVDKTIPQFTWRQPVVSCNSSALLFTYEFRVVELLPGQKPDDAMDRNANIYIARNLTVPMVTIPVTYINRMDVTKTYVAQVQATQTGVGSKMLNYVMLENNGKSPYRMFQLQEQKVEEKKPDEKADDEEKKDEEKKEEEKKDDKEEEPEKVADAGAAGGDGGDKAEQDSLYVFKNPVIRAPHFEDGYTRKLFLEEDIQVEFRRAAYSSGEGERQDTLKFEYTIELFTGDQSKGKEAALKSKPFYTKVLKGAEDDEWLIEWAKELSDKKLAHGQYVVLRVTPKCTNEKSIRYTGEDNVMDMALSERLSQSYFQCASTVTVTNNEPTKKKDSELKGSKVAIGEYTLTIDEIKKDKKGDTYEGKGHIEWNPMGFKVMIAVKFDDLKINTEDQVFAGKAVTYQAEAEKKLSDSEVVDKLFSDWGIDNLIGDTKIPYSKEIQQQTTSGIKNVAQKLNISKYYSYIKKGQSVWDQFLKGEIKDLHLPLQLPKSINKTPVDIQIVSMKFGHNYATMDVLGEFTLPNSKYYTNDILLLGAPRLCISPNTVLPEGGTIALLGDFTVNDPESSFDMTFKAPENVLEPTDGCFISWSQGSLELFEVDVDMKIPSLRKVDAKGNATNEQPILNFHASIGSWDDWFAEASMDMFEPEDLKGWTFAPGDKIVYDHSKNRNAPGVVLPTNYDRQKAGLTKDTDWEGLYIKRMGVIFPKMLSISDTKKNFEGRLRLDAENMFFDGSGATFTFGVNNVFDFNTAKVGGWGISMDEIKMEVMQSSFVKAYFNGKIQTPLEGKIGYRCDMYAQGKDEKGKTDPNRSAYIFKTQQVEGLSFDFWLGDMKFVKDQTYFLVEHETFKNKDSETRVELCMGGDITITVGRSKLRSMGKVGAFVDSKIPGIHVTGMRIANCPRWKSNYTQNQYEAPAKGGMNDFFGWKTENNIATDKFYFSLGRWSLASEKKTLGCFDFNLKDFSFGYKNKQATLGITGQVSIMNGQLSADCGLDIVADVNLDKYSFKFNTVKFKKAAFDSSFGGVTVKGTLEAADGNDSGYKGEVEFALPGGFLGFKANGGYFKRDSGSEKFTWGYFIATVQSSVGLRFDPVVITKLTGGFYFNCKAPKVIGATPTSDDAKDGVIGGVLGVGLATSGGDNLLSAEMTLQVCYDTNRKKLSSIIMDGKLDAFKASPNDKGLVSAECQLAYVNDTEKYIELNITASGGASLDNTMKEKLKALTGADVKLPKDVKQGLSKVTEEEQKDASKKTSSPDTSKTESGMKASCGFEVSLNFKVTLASGSGKKAKWHVYIGEPEYEKRCKLTLIDFQLGKKTDYFAAWAYLGATMYFCIGNELPNGGMLPDPPKAVMDFLNGTDVNGKQQAEGSKATSAKNKTLNQIKNLINSGTVSGGVMLGACAEGDFGVNAGIVYASGAFCFGFDLVLEKFGDGAKCQGGKSMGYKGWYAMGQAYAMLKGDLGVRVKLWFIDKKVSLISVGLGAMLQAGLPNPTWVYGKVRARCSLLGGIFKFNHAIEFKAGDVCMPDYGNPLDNLKMFASATPGYENDSKKGWDYSNRVSAYSEPRFVTNYVMNRSIRLVDENVSHAQMDKGAEESEARANSERIYKFELGTLELYNQETGQLKKFTAESNNDVDWKCICGTLEPDTRYKMTLRGYAKEYFSSSKKGKSGWDNPEIDGKRQEKKEETTYYFYTGPLEPTIDRDVVYSTCGSYDGMYATVRLEDAANPHLSLNRHRTDLTNSSKYAIKWEVWKGDRRLYTCDNEVLTGTNNCYEIWRPKYNLGSFFPVGVKGGAYERAMWDWGYGYRIICVRLDKSLMNIEMSKTQTKTNKSTKQNTDTHSKSVKSAIGVTQPSGVASSNVAAKMNDFFANQEKEEQGSNKSSLDEKSQKMTDQAKRQDGRYELYTIEFDKTVDTKFANETSFYYEYTNRYTDVYIALSDFDTNNPSTFSSVPTDESSTFLGGLTRQSDGSYYQNLDTKFQNAYSAAAYYANYLGLGGRTVNKFLLYDYSQTNIQGFEFTWTQSNGAGYLRSKKTLDGILSVDSKSTCFSQAFWNYAPLRRRDGTYMTPSNKGKEASWYGVMRGFEGGGQNFAPRGTKTTLSDDKSLKESDYFNYTLGQAMVSDAMLVDLFSHDLQAISRAMYKFMYRIVNYIRNDYDWTTGAIWYEKDANGNYKKDKKGNKIQGHYSNKATYAWQRLRGIYENYKNTVVTRSQSSQYWEYTKNKYWVYSYWGDYKIPLNQVMLAIWMSGDLKKVESTEFYGDPIASFNKNNFPHRYKNMKSAWNSMYYNTFGANTLLSNWKSLTFSKYIPDAYNINTGKWDVWFSRHRNTNKFVLSNPFSGFSVTRKSTKDREYK